MIAATVALSALSACDRHAPTSGPAPVTLVLTLAGLPRELGIATLPPSGDRVRSLDPAHANDAASADQSALVYETLYAYHYLKRPYVIVPRLAEATPVIAADGKTVTITLKKGVLFQDDRCFAETGGRGRELTADDVVYSLRRIADPRTGAEHAWSMLDGWIEGLSTWREAVAKVATNAPLGSVGAPPIPDPATITGIRALDRYRVEIHLTSPALASALPTLLAHAFTAIVPHEAAEAYGGELGTHPVGTGPFQLVKMNTAARLVWQRNPTFRHDTYPTEGEASDRAAGLLNVSGRALPLVERLIVNADDDPAHAWASLLAGEVDLAPAPEALPSPLPPELEIKSFDHTENGYLSFNMKDTFVGQTRALRLAIRLALGSREMPTPEVPAGAQIAPDPSQARQILSMAGFPGGMELPTLDVGYDGSNLADRDAIQALRAFLDPIGIHLHPRELKGSELDAELKAAKIPLWAGSIEGNVAVSEFARGLNAAAAGEQTEDRSASFGFRRTVRFGVRKRLRNFKFHDLGVGMARYYDVEM